MSSPCVVAWLQKHLVQKPCWAEHDTFGIQALLEKSVQAIKTLGYLSICQNN